VWEEKEQATDKEDERKRGVERGGSPPPTPLTSLSSSASLCVGPYCTGDSSKEERDEGETK